MLAVATFLLINKKRGLVRKFLGTAFAVLLLLLLWFIFESIAPDYVEFLIFRLENFSTGGSNYRLQEITRELELWSEFPVFGHGAGLRYVYESAAGAPFFGHNVFSSMLARYGLAGLVFLSAVAFYINRLLISVQTDKAFKLILVTFFVCITLQLSVGNFTYHPAMGFYGAIFGLLSMVNKRDKRVSLHHSNTAKYGSERPV